MKKNNNHSLKMGFVATATGKQLDDIGEIIGCERNDKLDEPEADVDYRERIIKMLKRSVKIFLTNPEI